MAPLPLARMRLWAEPARRPSVLMRLFWIRFGSAPWTYAVDVSASGLTVNEPTVIDLFVPWTEISSVAAGPGSNLATIRTSGGPLTLGPSHIRERDGELDESCRKERLDALLDALDRARASESNKESSVPVDDDLTPNPRELGD